MNLKEKNKKKLFAGKRFILSLVFLCVSFVFLNIYGISFKEASAADLPCCTQEQLDKCKDVYPATNQTTCYLNQGCDSGMLSEECRKQTGSPIVTQYNEKATKTNEGATKDNKSWFLLGINYLLYAVFKLIGAIVVIAGLIFDWAVNANNFKEVMEMDAIHNGWIMVRDFLNLFFILVLLFSAFCTIFQVEKYNIKKILLNLVIMALLVNFSFPIAMFVIDSANIPMYYFFQNIAGSADSISANLTGVSSGTSGIRSFIFPDNTEITGSDNMTFQLIAAIIFIFLFGVTLMVIAVLLIIRILVLAVLVIFAPVGFVAAIFPGFNKYSSSWWSSLFKQSFFGTIMAFMLYLSILIMQEAQNGVMKTLTSTVEGGMANTGGDFSRVVVGGVTLAIPIVLLWIGIISAQKMGAIGAQKVGGMATKFATGALKKFSGYNFGKKQYNTYAAARKKREEEKAKTRFGGSIGRGLNRGQDTILSYIPGFRKDASKRLKKTKTTDFDEDSKKAADGHDSTPTVNIITHLNSPVNIAAASDPNNRTAAIEYAGQYKQLISDPVRKTEYEAGIRSSNMAAAIASAAIYTDPAEKQAAIESYIQNAIASAWGTLKANFNTVKTNHTRV